MLVPKTYPLLERVVEEGVTYGFHKAHKHTDNPSEVEICSAIEDSVMSFIAEAFEFVDHTKP